MSEIGQAKQGEEQRGYLFARWMSWLFLVGAILVLLYTYYRAELVLQGTMGERYFKYYFVSGVGIIFWGVVLRLQEEIRARIVLVVTSLVVGLYMVEGTLNFALGFHGPRDKYFAAKIATAADLGIDYDTRTRFQVVGDLRAEGVDAVLVVYPSLFVAPDGLRKVGSEPLFPLGGVSRKTTLYLNETGRYCIYPSDRYGFNNPDSEWDSPQIEWLLIGDSFAHGAAVQPGEDIAGHIRSTTNDSAINLGYGGNGLLLELATLKEYAEALRPKKVLWLYFEGNDLWNLANEQNSPLLMEYLQDGFSQDLLHQQKEIDDRLDEYITKAIGRTDWLRLYTIRKLIHAYVGADVGPDSPVILDPLFTKILTQAKARTEAWGGKLYFVYLPRFERYSRAVDHDLFSKRAEVIEVVKGINIPVIDIHSEVFGEHPDPTTLFPLPVKDVHYNAAGYREVAKAIVQGLSGS